MSHSITTTASYLLNKYSRSYPLTTSLQGTPTTIESEWQHFTNPVMKIVLDAKKSPSGQLLSMRLRILWNLPTQPDDDLQNDQREVVFVSKQFRLLEDLELLSFSSLPTFQAPGHLQSDQSLPLKAVYRDGVVGIRYLHPKVTRPSSQPTYRRFQITFKDALDAPQCIDAIKSVCPCKANPQPTYINRRSTMLPSSLTRTVTTMHGLVPVRSAKPTEWQNISSASIDHRAVPSTLPSHSPESQVFASIVTPSTMTSLSSDDSAFVTCSETSQRPDPQVDHYRKDDPPKSRGHDSAQSSLPNSSQPSSSDQSGTMPPPPVPRRATHADATTQGPPDMVSLNDDGAQLLASLGEHPSLYELSRADLETLVSRVIREEGFLRLLESLDSLWRVKGFLGR